MRNVRAFAAALEREKITERTQRGRRARVVSGKPFVSPKAPYGYVWNETKTAFVIDPATAPVVRDIFDMALSGLSLRAIGAALEARGVPSPNGGATWTATSVRQLLTRSSYAGSMSPTGVATSGAPTGRATPAPTGRRTSLWCSPMLLRPS